MIYKLLRDAEWQELRRGGLAQGAPVDVADGFIHFSTAEQVAETARRHFAGAEDLWLIVFDTDRMGDGLKWEVSRGGAEFPHYYGPLQREHVVRSEPLYLERGKHVFPPDLA